MSKKSVWQEINEKVRRKKALKEEMAARRVNVEAFVLKQIEEIDQMMASTVNTSLAPVLADFYVKAVLQRMKVLDRDVKIEASWHNAEGDKPKISGILIKWSPEYQAANNCEPELFVDVISLLFR